MAKIYSNNQPDPKYKSESSQSQSRSASGQKAGAAGVPGEVQSIPQDIPEVVEPEPKVDTQQEGDEAELQNKKKQQLRTQNERDVKTERPRSQDSQKSQFQQKGQNQNSAQIPEQFGKKLDLSALQNLDRSQAQKQNQARSQDSKSQFQNAKQAQNFTQAKALPRPPQAFYKSLAQHPQFQGPLKSSVMHQKVQARALAKQNLQQQQQQKEGAEKPFTKSELLTLAALRHKSGMSGGEDQKWKKHFKEMWKLEKSRLTSENMQKVQNIRLKNQTQRQQSESAQQSRQVLAAKIGKQILSKLQNSSGESRFEQVLQKVLQGRQSVPNLPENVRARFAAKTDQEWQMFFQNVLNMNSALVKDKGQLASLIEGLFRGLFLQKSGKLTLVSDMAFSIDGEVLEEKFAQIELKNPQLAKLLKSLTPGDALTADILKMLGSDFEFTKLQHVPEGVRVLSDQEKQANLAEMRQNRSAHIQNEMEKALLLSRKKNEEEKKKLKDQLLGYPIREQKKDRFKGSPKGLMYMLYAVGGVTLALVLYILYRAVS